MSDGVECDDDDGGECGEDAMTTAPAWVWIGLIVLSIVSFWVQAVVTEERFVPSLNVLANRWSIPDDVAGATLMAAGASSPELFASLISLFVTKSSLGMGTIIGSEIFNQLVICAGSIWATRNGKLQLDKPIVIREMVFYGLSLAMLLVALSDRRPAYDDDETGENHLYVSFWDGLMLLGGYGLYVLVCAKFEAMLDWWHRRGRKRAGGTEAAVDDRPLPTVVTSTSGTDASKPVRVHELPFLRQVAHEPRNNFHSVLSQTDLATLDDGAAVTGLYRASSFASRGDDKREEGGDDDVPLAESRSYDDDEEGSSAKGGGDDATTTIDLAFSLSAAKETVAAAASSTVRKRKYGFGKRRLCSFLVDASAPKPSKIHGLDDIDRNESDGSLSCFLWQRSSFYNKARVDINAWQLRWFTFSANGRRAVSIPNRVGGDRREVVYPRFDRIEVDEDHLLLKLRCDDRSGRGSAAAARGEYILLAPTTEVLRAVVGTYEASRPPVGGGSFGDDPYGDGSDPEEEKAPSLVAFPRGASPLVLAVHAFLLPLKVLLHVTIPDVRHASRNPAGGKRLRESSLAILSSVIWLAAGSLVMVTSLERLGALMKIPDSVVGITVSAAGTSLPAYVASVVAARQGLGNMAVSNAFGSNTFNIFIGLGLPWTLYATFATKGESYHELKDDGITESVAILSFVLLSFAIWIVSTSFVLRKWHGYVFFGTYLLYLVYVIGGVYI